MGPTLTTEGSGRTWAAAFADAEHRRGSRLTRMLRALDRHDLSEARRIAGELEEEIRVDVGPNGIVHIECGDLSGNGHEFAEAFLDEVTRALGGAAAQTEYAELARTLRDTQRQSGQPNQRHDPRRLARLVRWLQPVNPQGPSCDSDVAGQSRDE